MMNEEKLLEIYNAAGGSTSCFLFFKRESPELMADLKKGKYIKYVENIESVPMYTCTNKLVLLFRDLNKDELKRVAMRRANREARRLEKLREVEELKNKEDE